MRISKNIFKALSFGIVAWTMMSCEDKINPKLESASPVLVVDAWLNNKPGNQVIQLTRTQPYFENLLPPPVSGASVTVSDDKGNTFTFNEDIASAGSYVWKPVASEVFGTVGNKYTLTIQINGETFKSTTRMGRVPPIDSISFETDKPAGSSDFRTRGEFWAIDPVGAGDAYWIRTYKNGILLNKPSEINIAFDAGFSAGGETDGVTFITPIRRGINSNDQDSSGKRLSPIVSGDSINVQMYSISQAAFNYLNQVSIQTDRPGGFQELFSTPLANVSTNVTNANVNGMKAVGFFNVAAVSSAGKRYKK